MKYTSNFLRLVLFLGAIGFLAPLLGCGGGGGSAGITEARVSNPPVTAANFPGTSPAGLNGCGADTLSPNFSSLIHPLYHWSRFPVKVYFANNIIITSSDGSKSDLSSIALSGFQEWSEATDGMVVIQVVSDAKSAQIIVHLHTLPGLPTASDTLGVEQSTLDSRGTLQHAEINMNTWPQMTLENIASFQETASHEFGHALGINGHSDNLDDVMYPSHSLYIFRTLSNRDINTLKTAYCDLTGKSAPIQPVGGTITTSIN